MKVLFRIVLAILASAMFAVAGQAPAQDKPQDKLVVWWAKGSYKAEDDALSAAVRRFEDKTGVKVELTQYPAEEMVARTVAALNAGTPPDAAYADAFDLQATAQWAFEARLADLSQVIDPIKDRFLKNTIETAYLHNDKTKKKAYYAFPVRQQTIHVQYWKDMLDVAGLKPADIPTGWKPFWEFWCGKARRGYESKKKDRVYGVGQSMGVNSTDSYFSFLTFADAYNVKMVDDDGKLRVDDPKVKQGLVNALDDYVSSFKKACAPPSTRVWRDEDNDAAFRNKVVMMTTNASIVVPAMWFDDANNAALSEEQRAEAGKRYDAVVTAPYPKKPDGSAMVYRASVKTGVVFDNAKNLKQAKEFVAFFLQDENLLPWVEGGQGRWFPVMKSGAASKFWQADAHRKAVHSQFGVGTLAFEFTRNHRFVQINKENVWAKAMGRVVNYEWTAERAVEEMIDRIKAAAGS